MWELGKKTRISCKRKSFQELTNEHKHKPDLNPMGVKILIETFKRTNKN